jgi:hypothetical protein
MDIHSLCNDMKEKVAADLLHARDPQEREDILIAALYELDRSVLTVLGPPKKTEEYLQRQAAVTDLVTFIAIPLIRNAGQRPRGVAVFTELGESCPDPLLKKKLAVYGQELLAKSSQQTGGAVISFPRIFFISGLVALCLLLLYYCWPILISQPDTTAPGMAAAPEPVRPPAQARLASAPAPADAPPQDAAAVAEKGGEEPRQPEKGQEQVTRVRVVNSQVLVPVLLKNGGQSVRVELVLDTGATRTAIHDTLVSRLRIDLRGAKLSQSELADGRIVTSRLARVDALQVGPFAMQSAELELISYKGSEGLHDGLLGMDFLGRHRYQIDVEHETIRWF